MSITSNQVNGTKSRIRITGEAEVNITESSTLEADNVIVLGGK